MPKVKKVYKVPEWKRKERIQERREQRQAALLSLEVTGPRCQMDPEMKAGWIAYLRSGDYKRTEQGTLRFPGGGYCCLGVLADRINPDAWTKVASDGETSFIWKDYKAPLPGAVGSFPLDYLKVIGLTDAAQSDLIELNDCGASFKVIADVIEKYIATKPTQ